MSLPFYFAWVDSTDTTFDPARHNVADLEIISFEVKHDEGQYPTFEVVVKNPRVGLLTSGRKIWAWFSWQGPSNIVPLFFGVLIGVPTDMFKELVTLKFLAQPEDYIEQRQAVAETMKVRPFWDPVFIDDKHRDDPDTILEGWSSLWHVDRVTLVTTASDILEGEDGTVDFTADKVLYDSVQMHLGQPPLAMVEVKASVQWSQRQSGYIQLPQINFVSYTGGSLISEWPKPGHGLGSGWRVEDSFMVDVYSVDQTPTCSSHGEWHNTDTNKIQCTPDSSTISSTWPALLSPDSIQATLTEQIVTGVCDPFSDPPTNRPAHVQDTGVIIPLWFLTGQMKLRYDAKRERSEELYFIMTADTQSVLTSPTIEQRSEVIAIQGSNVGEPLLNVEAWSDFAGQHVDLGQIIYPNDPTTPGGKSFQICTTAGTAGLTEPTFSDINGTVTIDGTVHWASMGESPLLTQPDWSPSSPVPLGEIICFSQQVFNPATAQFEQVPNSTSYYICTTPGVTNSVYTTLSYTPPPVTTDEAPQPVQHYTYIARPNFVTTQGAQVTDGSVVWTVLGVNPAMLQIPIGGTPENVPARCYFPSDRGRWSLEYLMCKARARLRHRSRAVNISFDVPFGEGVDLSCRQSATIHDPRLPGGQATGKITSYSLKCNGDTGEYICHVDIGCPVGRDGSASAADGSGVYATAGYMQSGYQVMEGAQITLGDISYTQPIFAPDDDGLNFPLTREQVIISENINGDKDTQKAAIVEAIPFSQALAAPTDPGFGLDFGGARNKGKIISRTGGSRSPSGAWALEQAARYWTAHAIPWAMEANPVWYELILKPVQNGPFASAYTLDVSPLHIPKGIDLEAPSSP